VITVYITKKGVYNEMFKQKHAKIQKSLFLKYKI
jgi:hypothetical protein